MQTFMPYADFAQTARVLDDRRLGKQRVEVLQILRALYREKYGWKHHPAVLMWRDHETALVAYGLAICDEWCRRGRADTVAAKIVEELTEVTGEAMSAEEIVKAAVHPSWIGDERVHASHRAALLRKEPDIYGEHFTEDPDMPYHWPTQHQATG